MPMSSKGPRKMRKFEMKRKKTKIACVQKVREPTACQKPCQIAPPVPSQVTSLPGASCTRKTTLTKSATRTTQRTSLAQNQERRRATTSCSFRRRSSIPNKLGQGMKRRRPRSTTPRKAITSPAAARSDQYHDQPTCRWNQRKATGLVRTATKVVARVSSRHWLASPAEDSRVERVGP